MIEQKKKDEKAARRQNMRRVHPHAAGIDLGSRTHFVAVGPDVTPEPVRSCDCCTPGLEAMALWLKECGVTTVAMEATGVYWIPVYQVLERHHLDVVLVNAQHFKSVPGRKSDVQDCQWLQHLHECGLLRGSFRPEDVIVVLRTYVRQRDTLVAESSRHVQRMQKALEQMNLQLHKKLSDITGESGIAIIKAILAGKRDPQELAKLCNYRVRCRPEQMIAALTGDYRDEHLFCLAQELGLYERLQDAIRSCEEAMARRLAELRTVSESQTKRRQQRTASRTHRSASSSFA
jgi:transposase